MKRQNNEPIFKDPVCNMQVSRLTAPDECVHMGKTYYFCATVCRETFQADPARYVRQHRQHGLKQA